MTRQNINDLLAFIAVAREGSFTKAAARFGISQSALSHTIRQLEARLGIRLLTISGRTPVVTPAEFTDAITVITPAEAKAAAKRAAKAAKKNPLSEGEKRVAFLGACACFALSGIAVIVGIWLIVGEHLMKLFGLA